MLLHATAVAIDGRAVLITGPSGAGKSDLALRLIDRGAVLVSDDQVELHVKDDRLIASAPAMIAGQMEVRGIGIVAMDHVDPIAVALLIEIAEQVNRMPEPRMRELCGRQIPVAALDPFEASGPIKAELALRQWGLTW
jgi:serine kinase of HPr protein (carbohydrate metabolism regulator)